MESARLWGFAIGAMALMVLMSSMVDLYYGIRASKAAGQYRTSSYGLRATAEKDTWYLLLYFLAACIDSCLSLWLPIPIACVLVAVGEIAIEGVSVYENHHRIRDGHADPVNVAKAIAKTYGIKDARKLELLIEDIRRQMQEAKGIREQKEGGTADGTK